MVKLTIEGIQKAQNANLAHVRSLRPEGSFGDAVKTATILSQQSAVRKTHVLTGSLRGSHRIKLTGLRGTVYIDPNSVNPRSGGKPYDYGVIEHAKGGQHAFYRRVVDEDGKSIAVASAKEYLRGMPR